MRPQPAERRSPTPTRRGRGQRCSVYCALPGRASMTRATARRRVDRLAVPTRRARCLCQCPDVRRQRPGPRSRSPSLNDGRPVVLQWTATNWCGTRSITSDTIDRDRHIYRSATSETPTVLKVLAPIGQRLQAHGRVALTEPLGTTARDMRDRPGHVPEHASHLGVTSPRSPGGGHKRARPERALPCARGGERREVRLSPDPLNSDQARRPAHPRKSPSGKGK
jgi:hypothetical protein